MALQLYFIVRMLMILFVYFAQSMMPLYFLTISTQGTMEKEVNHKLIVFDVLIDDNTPTFL